MASMTANLTAKSGMPHKPWLLAAILAALLGGCAWPAIGSRFASRAIELSFTLTGDGPVALHWTSPSPNPVHSNGIWIDVEDPLFRRVPDVDGKRTVTLVQNLPSYGASLSLDAAAPGTIEVTTAKLRTRVMTFRMPTRDLARGPSGANVSLGALPPVWRDTLWPGVPLAAVLGVFLVALARTAVLLVDAHDRRLSSPRLASLTDPATPKPRWLLPATIAACTAIPVFFAAWAPMFILADSTAYVWIAHLLFKTNSLMHFDGWRLPGYGLLIAGAMRLATDYAVVLGWLQMLLAIATPLLVFTMLRPRVGPLFASIAAIVLAIDPVLIGWQRVLMPETVSGFLIILAGWLFLRLVDRWPRLPHARVSTARTLLTAAALGLTCGAACITRGNNQVLPAVLITALIWIAATRRHWSLLASAGTVAATTFAVMLPCFWINYKNHDRFVFTIGRDFTRSLFSWENQTTDWNQCGTLSFPEFKWIRDELRSKPMTDWDVMERIAKTTTVPVPPGSNLWLAQDIRCGALVNEAVARQGPAVMLRQIQASTILLGVPITSPFYGVKGTWAVFTQLRGRDNHRTTSNFDFAVERFPPDMRETLSRSVHDVAWLYQNPIARVYGAWFNLWRWLRILMALAFLFALARIIIRREWAFAALGLVVLANIVGVPAMTYAAEYRYAAPYYPLMAAVIFFGVLRRPNRPRDHQSSPSSTPAHTL